ncbi:MAG: hypothetical protein ACK4TP_14755 [Hyphomicrobium sp.]
MTTREAFNQAAAKAFNAVFTTGLTVAGAVNGAGNTVTLSEQLFSTPAPVSAVLLSTVAGGVLSYAFAKAFLNFFDMEWYKADVGGAVRSHKGPVPPTA